MISPGQLADRFSRFLDEETVVAEHDGRLSLLTPAEYPDADGVTVVVDLSSDDRYIVSDMGAADALLDGRLGPQAVANKVPSIAERFEVEFIGGSFTATATESDLAETCWRVAQASAALAEGVTFHGLDALADLTFNDKVGEALVGTNTEVKRGAPLEGLSGYAHRTSFFLPATESVVEPIAGRKAWARARSVYTEFGDLSQVNGFQLVAVIDDRGVDDAPKLGELLSQVGSVGLWSERDRWLDTVTRRR